MKKTAYINGKSYYSMTTKRNTKGKFPSNCFEVGVTNIDYTDDNNELLVFGLEEIFPSGFKFEK